MTGGTEIQTLSLVKALVAAGHQPVTVCYFEHSDAMVQRYREAGSEVVLLSPDGKRPQGVRRYSRPSSAFLCNLEDDSNYGKYMHTQTSTRDDTEQSMALLYKIVRDLAKKPKP